MSRLDPLLRQSLFVAGTDTGVGKTWVTTRLLRAWVREGCRAAGMKPVAAGAERAAGGLRNEDALALQAAGNVALPYEVLNPCCLARPTSPHLAAQETGVSISCDTIKSNFDRIVSLSDLVAVEGAGGWWAPIGEPGHAGERGPTMEDVARALGLPVLLVVGVRLGSLNHALLTAAAIRGCGLRLAAWVANPIDPGFEDCAAYVESLQRRLPAPRVSVADDEVC
ncbi:MAG: dethiobiotin synthase [Steroidobacteraceae bacterium]